MGTKRRRAPKAETFSRYDTAAEEDMAAYLEACLEDAPDEANSTR